MDSRTTQTPDATDAPSLMYETLRSFNSQLARLADVIRALDGRVVALEDAFVSRLAGAAATTPHTTHTTHATNAEYDVLRTNLRGAIRDYWTRHKTPISLSILSRNYSRSALAHGGFRVVFDSLRDEVTSVITLAGATLIFPRDAYDALNERERLAFTERGLSERKLTHHLRAQQAVAHAKTNTLSDDEANAAAYEALIGSVSDANETHADADAHGADE